MSDDELDALANKVAHWEFGVTFHDAQKIARAYLACRAREAQSRSEGRREGMEQAAKVCDHLAAAFPDELFDEAASSIRALISAPEGRE